MINLRNALLQQTTADRATLNSQQESLKSLKNSSFPVMRRQSKIDSTSEQIQESIICVGKGEAELHRVDTVYIQRNGDI
eukprot:UN17613